MSKILKKYWKWDENVHIFFPFKIGDSLSQIKKKYSLIEHNFKEEYECKQFYSAKLFFKDEKLISIFFDDNFFNQFFEDSLWYLEIEKFIFIMNNAFIPVDENFKGNKIYVIFRDNFVALMGIIS